MEGRHVPPPEMNANVQHGTAREIVNLANGVRGALVANPAVEAGRREFGYCSTQAISTRSALPSMRRGRVLCFRAP